MYFRVSNVIKPPHTASSNNNTRDSNSYCRYIQASYFFFFCHVFVRFFGTEGKKDMVSCRFRGKEGRREGGKEGEKHRERRKETRKGVQLAVIAKSEGGYTYATGLSSAPETAV